MLAALFSRAETTAHEIAKDAGSILFVLALQFGAILFIFGGIAWALTDVMSQPLALIVSGVALGLLALVVLALKKDSDARASAAAAAAKKQKEEAKLSSSGLGAMAPLIDVAAQSLDVAVAGVVAREIRRRPLTALVAVTAASALLGALASQAASTDDSDDE